MRREVEWDEMESKYKGRRREKVKEKEGQRKGEIWSDLEKRGGKGGKGKKDKRI